MMKPKVALVKSGFLPAGSENVRGRLSRAAIAECERLVRDEGWDIEGYKSSDTQSVERVKPTAGVKTIADIGWPTRDENALRAMCGKVDVGMRTICQNCRGSLNYCRCESPRVWLDHLRLGVVTFIPKTG